MINFQPSEEQDLLRQTLSGFAREVVRPAAREAGRDPRGDGWLR